MSAENAWRIAMERCASIAQNACLVPPDGGSPSEEERVMCALAAEYIMEAPMPPAFRAEVEAEVAAMRARKDAAYEERNRVVAALARLFPSGTKRTDIPGWDDEWHGCVYIDTPAGQLSWHFHDSQAHLFADLPAYSGDWDGHDTPEKYRRLAAVNRAAVEAEAEELRKEIVDLKSWVIAFGAPWASSYGEQHFGPGMMHPDHYDILERCGARMASFTRARLEAKGESHE